MCPQWGEMVCKHYQLFSKNYSKDSSISVLNLNPGFFHLELGDEILNKFTNNVCLIDIRTT